MNDVLLLVVHALLLLLVNQLLLLFILLLNVLLLLLLIVLLLLLAVLLLLLFLWLLAIPLLPDSWRGLVLCSAARRRWRRSVNGGSLDARVKEDQGPVGI